MPDLSELRRVVLKISGEALKGANTAGVDMHAIDKVAARLQSLKEQGIQTGLVMGGGNFLRGVSVENDTQTPGLTRYTADMMGMMGTVINALALRDGLNYRGIAATIVAPFSIAGITIPFDKEECEERFKQDEVLILAGGTGHPYFTTDTAAALRACELDADVILKATKVDGVYSDDPNKVQQAERYRCISFQDALHQRIGVMDEAAFSLCYQNDVPIIVFNFADPEGIRDVLAGKLQRATLVSAESTEVAKE